MMGDVVEGANAVKRLMAEIEGISSATCDSLDEPGADAVDGRDYRRITDLIEARLVALAAGRPEVRHGACRALADLLTQLADDGAASEHWDPLGATRPAFVEVIPGAGRR